MSKKKAELLMVSVTFVWGISYLLMKIGLDRIEPFNLIFLRFGIAFLGMTLLFFPQMKKINRTTLKKGILTGVILFMVFAGMVCGVNLTTASAAGFLTSAAVILVPVLECLIYRRFPGKKLVFSLVLIAAGLYLLTVTDGISMDLGAVYCLGGAFFYAVYILVMDQIAKNEETILLSIIQLGTASVLGGVCMILFETPSLPATAVQWGAILALGLLCSAYGFVVQPIAQRYTSPERIGIIFSLEPVFSAVLAYLILHEILGQKGYIGALLVLAGVLISNASRNAEAKGAKETEEQAAECVRV